MPTDRCRLTHPHVTQPAPTEGPDPDDRTDAEPHAGRHRHHTPVLARQLETQRPRLLLRWRGNAPRRVPRQRPRRRRRARRTCCGARPTTRPPIVVDNGRRRARRSSRKPPTISTCGPSCPACRHWPTRSSRSTRERHPELVDIAACFATVRADLEPHLTKEERVLFPMIRELATADSAPTFHCGSMEPDLGDARRARHRRRASRRLRALTNGYPTPADGCASYAALFSGLASWKPTPTCTSTRRTTCCSRPSSPPNGRWRRDRPPLTDDDLRQPRRSDRRRADVELLVRSFYRYAAMDELLGPIFSAAHVDWHVTRRHPHRLLVMAAARRTRLHRPTAASPRARPRRYACVHHGWRRSAG